MFTTLMSPKMSEKPLATMNSHAGKRQGVEQGLEERLQVMDGRPGFVVRQLPFRTLT